VIFRVVSNTHLSGLLSGHCATVATQVTKNMTSAAMMVQFRISPAQLTKWRGAFVYCCLYANNSSVCNIVSAGYQRLLTLREFSKMSSARDYSEYSSVYRWLYLVCIKREKWRLHALIVFADSDGCCANSFTFLVASARCCFPVR